MKILFFRHEIINTLKRLASVASKSTIPITEHILIKAEADRVVLVATDLRIEVRETLYLGIKEPGEITVPAKKLYSIVNSFKDEKDITLEAVDGKVIVKCGKAKLMLSALPAESFPASEFASDSEFFINTDQVAELIDKVLFAAANHDVRYYLNGVCFDFKENCITAVGTDGHRLAKREFAIETELTGQKIIHSKSVSEIKKLLPTNTPVRMSISDTKIMLDIDNIVITSALIDGKYPNYMKVIPKKGEAIVVDKASLESALARVLIVSSDTKGVRVTCKENAICLDSANQNETANESVDLLVGDEVETGLNGEYLLDVLKVLDGETVNLYISGPDQPILITGDQDPGCEYVIMPMKL